MKSNDEEVISHLVGEWYKTIANEHHKDRDCHFTIEHTYSYGGESKWAVIHNGYILDDVYETFASLQSAQLWLIRFLRKSIAQEKRLQERDK